jgi:hypothetical protein
MIKASSLGRMWHVEAEPFVIELTKRSKPNWTLGPRSIRHRIAR